MKARITQTPSMICFATRIWYKFLLKGDTEQTIVSINNTFLVQSPILRRIQYDFDFRDFVNSC